VGAIVWSPLGWGRLTGRIRRGGDLPPDSRLHVTSDAGPPVDDETLFDVVEVLVEIARETGRTVPQVAVNWLLRRPTVSSVIIGARTEAQLRDNLSSVGWVLDAEQIARLDVVSERDAAYPYFPYRRQEGFARLSPPLV
ncbi:aldo/keto reductase, partial [Williamsia sp.]|uniref:aldo/keto reductase n=1 Tax=Williamsia sp. TaxID=1872085 RepID=UPI001A35B60F